VPRVDEGSAVPRAEVLRTFERIGVETPDPERLWVVRTVDLGAEAARGVGRYPTVEGETYACLVSAVDVDGNEVAGVRLPAIEEPVATHTGWNLRDPSTGAPEQQVPMRGTTHFFAPTRTARATADPRATVSERYPDRETYEAAARAVAVQLVADRYLLEADVPLGVGDALAIYDEAVGRGS
jgi:hypothetical protein